MNKPELRKLYLEKRSGLTEEQGNAWSKRIAENLFKNVDFSAVTTVHIFLPIKHKAEIDTWIIIDSLKNRFPSVKIIIPKMVGNRLDAYVLEKDTILEENKWSIPEPADGEKLSPWDIDLVLVPLLVFDTKGNRIGYGKGFYDQFLLTCREDVVKVGLSFFDPVEAIDAEAFDVPLQYCVTPDRFYSFF